MLPGHVEDGRHTVRSQEGLRRSADIAWGLRPTSAGLQFMDIAADRAPVVHALFAPRSDGQCEAISARCASARQYGFIGSAGGRRASHAAGSSRRDGSGRRHALADDGVKFAVPCKSRI